MTARIKGGEKMAAALTRMATAFNGVSEAALAAAAANVRFHMAADWGKSVSDYARFGMDPCKSPSFTAVSVSGPRESPAESFVTIQPSRFGKTEYFERRIAELRGDARAVFRVDEATMAKMREKARSRVEAFTMRALGGNPVTENIRTTLEDALEGGRLHFPPPRNAYFYRSFLELEAEPVTPTKWKTYFSAYPLFAPRYPNIMLNLAEGDFPTLEVTLPDTPRGRRAVAMWLRQPADRRRRKRARRILKHELKLEAEARRGVWS